MMRFAISTAFLICFLPCTLFCQPAFEVASIKPDDFVPGLGNPRSLAVSCVNGRFISRNATVWYLIKWAWNIQDNDRLVGYPGWTNNGDNFYVIEAKAATPVGEEQCRLMLRTLLADRFRLRTHEERRLFDAFDLVIAKGGRKIKRVTDPNAPINGPGFTISGQSMQILNPKAKGWTMEQLALMLGYPITGLGRKVFDRTGLDGIYRIDLTFRRREDPDGAGPDITTALREQLGLELRTAKEPLDVLVIDHVERPSAN